MGPPIANIDYYTYGCDLVGLISAELTRGALPRQKCIEKGLKTKEVNENK